MKSKLISFILALCLLIAIPLEARYKYNPFTRKLDYYETGADIDLGDLADITLTGLANGDILYYNGTAWVNLTAGAGATVLTVAGGIPSWQPAGAPVAHAASHEVGGGDLVDHDQLTNYLAAQHLTLPNTIANVLTDHNLATHTALGIAHPANVFYVSATGGDYATIQAALTAQNAGGETFLIGPGTYAGDTIHFTANDQVVKPLGHAANVIITQADANIVDGGVFTDCIVEGIEIRLTAPTTAINAIQVGTGTLIIIECRGYLATAVALVAADQPSLVGFTGAGTIRIKRGNYQYYHTGNTGGGGIKATFRANVNLAQLHLHKLDVVTITNSGTAAATVMYVTTGTAVTQMHNVIDAVVTDPNATLVVGLGYVGGAGAHNILGNHVDVVATNNTAYGLYHNGTATVRSAFNAIHSSDVAGSSYALFVGASATLNSHFDDLRSDDGNNVAGTLNLVSSESDGDMRMTDELDVDGVSEFNADTNSYEDIFWTWADAADHASIIQSSGTGTEDQALIYIQDDRAGSETDEPGEATVVINNTGGIWALWIQNRNFQVEDTSYFEGDTYQKEDVFWSWADVADNAVIAQTAVAGIEDVPLIFINDDRTGATVDEKGEASIVIDAEGTYALYVEDGILQVDGPSHFANLTYLDDIVILNTQKNFYIGSQTAWWFKWDQNDAGDDILMWCSSLIAAATETKAWFISDEDPAGMTDHDDYISPTLVITNSQAADANDYAGVVIGERTQASVLVAHYFDFYAMTGATDGSVDVNAAEIGATFRFGDSGSTVPTYATGPGDVIFEDDIEVIGGAYFPGQSFFFSAMSIQTTATVSDNNVLYFGNGNDTGFSHVTVGTNDDFFVLDIAGTAGVTEAIWIADYLISQGFGNFTDLDDFLSPTLVIVNAEGADAKDYSAVMIGERGQADVKVAHYFDFYAMTGAIDGVVDPANAEIAATFRFGDTGTTVPTYATGPGDVIFEDDFEVIGGTHHLGDETTYEDVFWTWADTADHAVIAQSNAAGTEDVPLIFIDDDRTGATATELSEATINIDAEGVYAMAIMDGDFWVNDTVQLGTGRIDPVNQTLYVQTSTAFSSTYLDLKGNSLPGFFSVFDSDAAEYLSLTCVFGTGEITTLGVAPGGINFLSLTAGNATFWSGITAGNPYFYIYGWDGAAPRYLRTSVDSNGDALIEPQQDLSILKGDGVYSLTVNFDDADPTALCTVADGYVVTDVWIEVTTVWDGNGYIEVGDGNDDDGFMNNTNYDKTTAAYYGYDENDRGDYLTNSLQYIYTGADTIDIAVTTGSSTQGVATVYVHITRLK